MIKDGKYYLFKNFWSYYLLHPDLLGKENLNRLELIEA